MRGCEPICRTIAPARAQWRAALRRLDHRAGVDLVGLRTTEHDRALWAENLDDPVFKPTFGQIVCFKSLVADIRIKVTKAPASSFPTNMEPSLAAPVQPIKFVLSF